jgi:diaminopimelate epimerase
VAVFEFIKMSGTGNDFIVTDNRNGKIPEEAKPGLARTLCPRRTAVGADGLLLLEMSDTADVRMRIFNADGTEPEMCGNGSRCLAYFARRLRAAGPEMMIETLAGVLRAEVDDHTVRVDLTRPKEISTYGELEFAGERREVFFADTGVPHAVVFVDDLDAVDVREWGRAIRNHGEFQPWGANANFVKIDELGSIAIRTYERGVEDETLACGTGAVASALVSAWREGWDETVSVRVRSGEDLGVHFHGPAPEYERAMLEGDVSVVFLGEAALSDSMIGKQSASP